MNSPNPLPSLFGRFTSILQDHAHLGKTLRRLRSMCTALEGGQVEFAPELAPQRLVAELLEDLTEHFRAEEAAEYFGVVIDEAPSLVPEIARLKWEHLIMLRIAQGLDELAQNRASWNQLVPLTRKLIADLEQHERSESGLLRQWFFPKR